MGFVAELLKAGEGENPLCVICGRRKEENTIADDGVSVCTACYHKLMEAKVSDYYETENLLNRLFAPFTYEGKLRESIFKLKFNGCPKFAGALGKLILDALPPYYLYDFDMIVPVPLSRERQEERGYNQAKLLAEPIAKGLDIPLKDDVLFRIRDTKRQMNLSRSLRDLNVRGAFFAPEGEVKGKKILLIDDIYTAGSTANESTREMLSKGAESVTCLVLCSNFYKESKNEYRVSIPTVFKK